jgi:hypothetical protein
MFSSSFLAGIITDTLYCLVLELFSFKKGNFENNIKLDKSPAMY